MLHQIRLRFVVLKGGKEGRQAWFNRLPGVKDGIVFPASVLWCS